MKFFLDTADGAAVKRLTGTGLVDGVTTNPSHLSKAQKPPLQQIYELMKLLPEGHISVEVTQKEPDAVYNQAKKIAALGSTIVVKIPCHVAYYPVIKKLVHEGITINSTLVFTLAQATMMCKLGVAYISPFVGRLEDTGIDGIQLLHDSRTMIDRYDFSTQVLAASLRTQEHLYKAICAGVDCATVSISLFEQLVQSSLTERGMAEFDSDWQKLGVTHFP